MRTIRALWNRLRRAAVEGAVSGERRFEGLPVPDGASRSPMLFSVVGTGRCGSTLLGEMMNLRPELFVFRESHWIPKLFEAFGLTRAAPAEMVEMVLRTYFITGERVIQCDEATLRNLFPEAAETGVAAFCERIGSAFSARDVRRALGSTIEADS